MSSVAFVRDVWGKKSYFYRGDARRYEFLHFGSESLGEALCGPDGAVLGPSIAYNRSDGKHVVEPIPGRCHLSAQGCATLALRRVESLFPRVEWLLASVQRSLGIGGEISCASHSSSDGNGAEFHFDPQAVFILQIEGEKRWSYTPTPTVDWPSHGNISNAFREERSALLLSPPRLNDERLVERLLSPGDLLYLPAGTWHRAKAIGRSLALTLSYRPLNPGDLIRRRVARALTSAGRPLALLRDRTARVHADDVMHIDRILTDFKQTLEEVSPAQLGADWLEQVSSAGKAPLRSEVSSISEYTRLSPAGGFPLVYATDPRDACLRLYSASGSVELPIESEVLVAELCARDQFKARDVCGFVTEQPLRWSAVQTFLSELVHASVLGLR